MVITTCLSNTHTIMVAAISEILSLLRTWVTLRGQFILNGAQSVIVVIQELVEKNVIFRI